MGAYGNERPILSSLNCGTWNVQGLTEIKELELIEHMKRYQIDILCIQETRKTKAGVYEVEGFQIILSGADTVTRINKAGRELDLLWHRGVNGW